MLQRLVLFVVALVSVMLAACSRPAATADPIASLIVQSGDIPSRYQTFTTPMPWRIYPGIPETRQVYYYEIATASDRTNEIGHVTVARYPDAATADAAYEAIRAEAELDKDVQPLAFGERGSQSGPVPGWNSSDVLFQRCNTVVHIAMDGADLPDALAYAERLHNRLQPAVC